MKYTIGKTYWFKNEYAGRNMQSCGTLERFIGDNEAEMYNKRYGLIVVTIDNLDQHN